jgi:uridine kinase
VDPDVCLLRRVKRDLRDRGRNIEGVYRQYLDTVKPMFEKYIRNYVEYADLIVNRGGKNAKIVDILAHYINSGLV